MKAVCFQTSCKEAVWIEVEEALSGGQPFQQIAGPLEALQQVDCRYRKATYTLLTLPVITTLYKSRHLYEDSTVNAFEYLLLI